MRMKVRSLILTNERIQGKFAKFSPIEIVFNLAELSNIPPKSPRQGLRQFRG
jgi:hypothetical protein